MSKPPRIYSSLDELLKEDIEFVSQSKEYYYIKLKSDDYYDNSVWRVNRSSGEVDFIMYPDYVMLSPEPMTVDTRTFRYDHTKHGGSLQHHGIDGMHWGVRNGPPYPLSRQQRYGGNEKNGSNYRSGAKNPTNKKATYQQAGKQTGQKLNKYQKAFDKATKRFVEGKGHSENDPQKNGMYLLDKSEDTATAIRNTNPYIGTPFAPNNCVSCSVASFLRTRGYDVNASMMMKPVMPYSYLQASIKNFNECCSTINGRNFRMFPKTKATNAVLKLTGGKDGYGCVSIPWKGANVGHCFNWEVKNGKVSFFDAQTGDPKRDCSKYFDRVNTTGRYVLDFFRLDNADFNYSELTKLVDKDPATKIKKMRELVLA